LAWYNYGLSFEGEESRKERLGCFIECMKVVEFIKKSHLGNLDQHKVFIVKQLNEMESNCVG
jgi:hypothetical protein